MVQIALSTFSSISFVFFLSKISQILFLIFLSQKSYLGFHENISIQFHSLSKIINKSGIDFITDLRLLSSFDLIISIVLRFTK